MEKFCQHIEKLLAQHDYVVVPNLGGFVIQSQSAEILSDCIKPPLSTISFNPLMHHADGLLAIEIARSEQISYRLAMEYIDEKVHDMKAQLKTSKPIQFGNIGDFIQDEHGRIIFTPSGETDFIPQNFQFSEVYTPTKESRKNNKQVTFRLPSAHFLKYVGVAIIVVSLLFFTPNKVSDVRVNNTASLVSVSFETKAKAAIGNSVISPKTEIQIKDSLKTIKTEEVHSYHVIIASLATQKSAEKLCNELSSNEFPTAHVLPPSKTYRIAIESFNDKDQAIEYMEKLRESDSRFETAWVLCN